MVPGWEFGSEMRARSRKSPLALTAALHSIATVDDTTYACGGEKGLVLEYDVDTLEYLIALYS